eukprot:1324534-Pyramimonas_sp.AAC.1
MERRGRRRRRRRRRKNRKRTKSGARTLALGGQLCPSSLCDFQVSKTKNSQARDWQVLKDVPDA